MSPNQLIRLEGPEFPEPETCTIAELLAANVGDEYVAESLRRLKPGESYFFAENDCTVTLLESA